MSIYHRPLPKVRVALSLALLAVFLFLPAAFARLPSIRKIRPDKEPVVAARIEFNRAKLQPKFQRRNNFAWAIAKIDGLEKKEYFAHSGISKISDIAQGKAREAAEGVSLMRKKQRFQVYCVNGNDEIEGHDCWFRNVDTESKILEEMASLLPSPEASGRVVLYTDLHPCASCWRVIQEFLDAFPRIQMLVLYREL